MFDFEKWHRWWLAAAVPANYMLSGVLLFGAIVTGISGLQAYRAGVFWVGRPGDKDGAIRKVTQPRQFRSNVSGLFFVSAIFTLAAIVAAVRPDLVQALVCAPKSN